MINGVIKILIDDLTLQGLIGKNKEGDKYKVYPVFCPQPEQHPYIVLRISGKEPIYCKGLKPTDFIYSFAVYAYANTYEKINDINEAIENALSNYTGTSDGVSLKEIRLSSMRDEGVEVAGQPLYCRIVTFDADVNED